MREGYIEPEPEDIEAWRAAVPNAGLDSDFIGVRMGELRSRCDQSQQTQHPGKRFCREYADRGCSGPLSMPVSVPAKQIHRWESGPGDAIRDRLYAEWATPNSDVKPVVQRVSEVSFTRDHLADLLATVGARLQEEPARWDYLESHQPVAMSLHVVHRTLAAGETAAWRRVRHVSEHIAKVRGLCPRAEKILEEGRERWLHPTRPTLHAAIAVLCLHGLLDQETVAFVSHRERPKAPQRWESGMGLAPSGSWGRAYEKSFTRSELATLLVNESLFPVDWPDVKEARLRVYREVRRFPKLLSGLRGRHHLERAWKARPDYQVMSLHKAIAILSFNGNGEGLGRRRSFSDVGVPPASRAAA